METIADFFMNCGNFAIFPEEGRVACSDRNILPQGGECLFERCPRYLYRLKVDRMIEMEPVVKIRDSLERATIYVMEDGTALEDDDPWEEYRPSSLIPLDIVEAKELLLNTREKMRDEIKKLIAEIEKIDRLYPEGGD